MKTFVLRLQPDQDLRQELQAFAISHDLQAACILSAIGSFKQVALRFADQATCTVLPGRYELLSLSGTLSIHGLHIHVAIADTEGKALGGHLTTGCLIYTTAEIIIGESENLVFLRTPDAQTGYLELEVQSRSRE